MLDMMVAPQATAGFRDGLELGRFVLARRLGIGGMGEVWEATDRGLGRVVALKLLQGNRAAPAGNSEHEHLLREARAMAKVPHPNIAVVYEVGTLGDQAFVAMELMRETLRSWLATSPPWRAIVERFVAAGRGLAAAHRGGIVHRDFKPENVLLGASGETKVSDFGLADALPPTFSRDVALQPLERITTSEAVAGTPAYMAPEQILGVGCDARADQFSFCVALWEALYGRLPFDVDAVEGIPTLGLRLAAITAGRFGTPRRGVPHAIHRLLRRGLDPDPDARFASMDELVGALERVTRHRSAMRVTLAAAAVATVTITAVAIASTRSSSNVSEARMGFRTVLPSVAYRRAPVVAVGPDGRMAIAQRASMPVLHLSTIEGLTRTRLALPDGLVPSALAFDLHSDAVLVGGRRADSWELWRTGAARSPVLIGVVPALAEARLDRDYIVSLGGDDVLVIAAGAVLRITPGGVTTFVEVKPGAAAVGLAASPSGAKIAILEERDGQRTIRIVDRAGITARVMTAPVRGFAVTIGWRSDRELVLADMIGGAAELVPVDVDLGMRGRPIGVIEGMVLTMYMTQAGIVAEYVVHDPELELYSRSTGERRDLNTAGWNVGMIAGWSDPQTIVTRSWLARRIAVVAFALDGDQRVLAEDGGTPVFFDGDRLVVIDNQERDCAVRAVQANRSTAMLPLSCSGDPSISCAGGLRAPCVLARWEDDRHVYRHFDPLTLSIGDIVYHDEDLHRPRFMQSALSADGRWLAIPLHRDGVRFVELATGRASTVRPTVDESWVLASWVTADSVSMMATASGRDTWLVEVHRDGRIAELARDEYNYGLVAPSPDGTQLAWSKLNLQTYMVLLPR